MEKSRFFNVILLSLSAGTVGVKCRGHPSKEGCPPTERFGNL